MLHIFSPPDCSEVKKEFCQSSEAWMLTHYLHVCF